MRLVKSYFFAFVFSLSLLWVQDLWAAAIPLLSGPYPADIAAIKKRGSINIAIYSGDVPPFFMQDDKGQWSGIEHDFGVMIADQLGVKANFKTVSSYDGIINMIANKQADIGLGLLSITPTRALMVRFSIPYYTYHPYLVVNRLQVGRLNWTLWNALSNLTTTDQSFKIGAITSSANAELIQVAFPSAEVAQYDSAPELMKAVESGAIFGAVIDTPEQVEDWFKQNPKAALNTGSILIPERSVLFGVAIQPQEENLQAWLNVYIDYAKRNKIINQLFEKYGIEETNT